MTRHVRAALAQAIARGIVGRDACITDPTQLLGDDIDVLVEAIGGTTTARTLVETAVATAPRLGYAEADPSRDLSGQDDEDTLRILAWMCFGVDPATLEVTRRGIDAETAAWAARVAIEGDRVKLITSCAREGDELVARILPTRITRDDPWARVTGPFNRIVVENESAGSLVFQGAGAGGRATAGAVLADIMAR